MNTLISNLLSPSAWLALALIAVPAILSALRGNGNPAIQGARFVFLKAARRPDKAVRPNADGQGINRPATGSN